MVNKKIIPELSLGGKTIRPASPKMLVWRKYLEFYEKDKSNLTLEEFLDAHIDLIVLGFGRPEVTRETLEGCIEIADVVPTAKQLFEWLQSEVFRKLAALPNEETETAG